MSPKTVRQAPETAALVELPLVGREEDLDLLLRSLDEARQGRGRAILVSGEVGMGKTRLLEEVSRHAREGGALVCVGRCWEGVDTPAYWPWIQVFRQVLGSEAADSIPGLGSDLLAQISPRHAEDAEIEESDESPGKSRFAIFDAAASMLSELAARRPLLLVLEDLEHADEASLSLLKFLSKTLGGSPILLLASFEETRANPDASIRILRDVARENTRVTLRPLNETSVAKMYELLSGEKPASAVQIGLFQASEGNPLFVVEATRALQSSEGLYRPDYSVGFRVPFGVRDIIRRRLEAMAPEVATLLSMASVIGRTFDAVLLAEVADLKSEAVLDLVAEAVGRGVLIESSALGRYAFTHILIRETLYEDLTPANRMRLHRRVAELLEARDEIPNAVELAHHWFKAAQAGDASKAMRYAVAAAKDLFATHAYADAARLCERALKTAEMAKATKKSVSEVSDLLVKARARSDSIAADGGVSDEMVFRLEGDFWQVAFDGVTSQLKDLKGLRYLARLLANPRQEIHVLDLVTEAGATAAPRGATTELGSGAPNPGEVLDAKAKEAFKQRIKDLLAEEEEANDFNDPERAARARAEIEALTQELSAAVGLGGRDRRLGSPAERARMSVNKALKDALTRIEKNIPPLGEHLRLTLHTGTYCSYSPDPRTPVSWQL